MERILVFSDIHGCYDKLCELIKKADLQKEDQLIFLGDYIDRGSDSKKVLDYLMNLKKDYDCIFLLGNHEEMFLNFINRPKISDIYLYNGGFTTLKNFQVNKEKGSNWEIDDKYINFIENMKLWYETEDYFFVHAGVPNKNLEEITENDKDYLIWTRDLFFQSEYIWDKIIIHGHTPIKEIDVNSEKVNIDTGCVYGGKLSCLVLPDLDVISI